MFHILIWGIKPTKAPRGDGTATTRPILFHSDLSLS